MRFKLIACDVFLRELCAYIARSPHIIDPEFTELGSHKNSDTLRKIIQIKIDEADGSDIAYDAILLGYGLCGNALAGITARNTKLVIPRAHDCCTIFLGSTAAFAKHFGPNPSQPFTTVGYYERCGTQVRQEDSISLDGKLYSFDEYARIYGEENARYIFEQLQPKSSSQKKRLIFIDMPGTPAGEALGHMEKAARDESREFVVLKGNGRLLENLVGGTWPKKDFCIIPPGNHIEAVYDWDEIVRSKKKKAGGRRLEA